MGNESSSGTVTADGVEFQFRCVSAEDQIYEATGKMAPHLPYTIKYRKILHLHLVHGQGQKEAEAKEKIHVPSKTAVKKHKSHKYSSGLHFFDKADVKRICCDQLVSLELHKERAIGNKERKHMVLRKLYKLGGWIREGRNKDRIYIPPDSPLPDFLIAKKARDTRGMGMELGFQ